MAKLVTNVIKIVVAIYIRVSTDTQVRGGHSLGEQEKRLVSLCEAKGYEIFKVYSDAGISGKSVENRSAYQQMMNDMKKGKFNRILAFKMDRLSRSISDFEEFFQKTEEYNCEVEFLEGNIDMTGASGKLFARILEVFAQFERELIVERTLLGIESAASKGHISGQPPLGYKAEIIDNVRTKRWIINEEEVPIVKEIFNMCLQGKTYRDISKIMKEKYPRVLVYYRKNKETEEKEPVYRAWNYSSISRILNNKCYIGIYEYRKRIKDKEIVEIENVVTPIIEESVFYECQENIQKNIRNYYRSKNYLFMQKIKCPKCGSIMACNGTRKSSGKDYLYYKCKNCKTYIREEQIEEIVIKRIISLLELYLVLEEDYILFDENTIKKLKKGKVNNKIRYAMDTVLIDKKLQYGNLDTLKNLWNLASYEVKCKFINEYIDYIKIRQYKVKNKTKNELVDLKLKSRISRQVHNMIEENAFDFYMDVYNANYCEFKSRKQADDYIEVLQEKYNINVVDTPDIDSYLFSNRSDNMFRIISIRSNRVVEKDKMLFLELVQE